MKLSILVGNGWHFKYLGQNCFGKWESHFLKLWGRTGTNEDWPFLFFYLGDWLAASLNIPVKWQCSLTSISLGLSFSSHSQHFYL